jgi:hypothetical protein
MKNVTVNLQTLTSIKFVKSSLSLYFFTLGSSFLGLSLYLFLETVGYTDKVITSWSGQSLFWVVIISSISIFFLFLPIEFFNQFKLSNSSFNELMVNIISTILISIFSLVLFQILLPENMLLSPYMGSLTRATSFSGFIVIPIFLFFLNYIERSIRLVSEYTYYFVLLMWIVSSKFFI